MSERDMTFEPRQRGARIYDAAGAETASHRPLADGEAYEAAEVAYDPNLANLLTISFVAVIILGLVFGMVALSSVL